MRFTHWLAGVAIVATAGCAATGVTLRSNHYRVHVPPDWEVVEAGGDGLLPTLLRVPASAKPDRPPIEIRLYPWVVQGPLANPPDEARQRLNKAGAIVPPSGEAAPEPCADRGEDFVIFGRTVRAFHVVDAGGMRGALTAGFAYGSLVGILATTRSTEASCADIEAMHAAIKQLTMYLAPAGDPTRPVVPPVQIEHPRGRSSVELPPADPTPPFP